VWLSFDVSLCDSCGIYAVIVAYCPVNSLIYDLMVLYNVYVTHGARTVKVMLMELSGDEFACIKIVFINVKQCS